MTPQEQENLLALFNSGGSNFRIALGILGAEQTLELMERYKELILNDWVESEQFGETLIILEGFEWVGFKTYCTGYMYRFFGHDLKFATHIKQDPSLKYQVRRIPELIIDDIYIKDQSWCQTLQLAKEYHLNYTIELIRKEHNF